MNETVVFDSDEVISVYARDILKEIITDLDEYGYNAIKQITGYLISGDPGYISNYKMCRSKIKKLDRSSVIEIMIREYIK